MAASVAQRIDVFLAMRRHPADLYARCLRAQPLAQRLQQHELAGLTRGDGEVARGLRGVERLIRPEQALHAGQDDVDGGRELHRLGGRHQLLAGAHEQLVGEDFAELGQRVADGRGAPAQTLGGAGDAGIDEQSVERHQQIGIDFPEVHGVQLFC